MRYFSIRDTSYIFWFVILPICGRWCPLPAKHPEVTASRPPNVKVCKSSSVDLRRLIMYNSTWLPWTYPLWQINYTRPGETPMYLPRPRWGRRRRRYSIEPRSQFYVKQFVRIGNNFCGTGTRNEAPVFGTISTNSGKRKFNLIKFCGRIIVDKLCMRVVSSLADVASKQRDLCKPRGERRYTSAWKPFLYCLHMDQQSCCNSISWAKLSQVSRSGFSLRAADRQFVCKELGKRYRLCCIWDYPMPWQHFCLLYK